MIKAKEVVNRFQIKYINNNHEENYVILATSYLLPITIYYLHNYLQVIYFQ